MKRGKNDDIVGSDGVELSGKKIVLCVSGSVAAYKSIELARLLIRHGAHVTCVASSAATRLIKPDYFKWATGNKVITKLTGDLEHIKLADYKRSDMIIVYPSTANTLGKLANGIDDTPISTVLTVGFGSKIPIIVAPAMHKSMYDNPAIRKNITFLKNKVDFIEPQIIEGKAKLQEPEHVVQYILEKFGFSSKLHGKKVLISAGPAIEYIDPVRVITNLSSGATGVLLAQELLVSGASVTMVYGPGTHAPPEGAAVIPVQTTAQMTSAIKKEMSKKYDIVIMAAAAADYTPQKRLATKIKSGKKISLKLKPVPKILDQIKRMQKDTFLVGFKAEAGISNAQLEKKARRRLVESGADLFIANDIGRPRYKKNPKYNEILVVDRKGARLSGWKKKEIIANIIRKEIEKRI